ncbi:MAG: GNAT family N-acetyltransferase [Phycisphaerae bacterium]|nr:GNAT family N-acetyltransferase [Phycisphaerae bacterium]
MEILSYDPAMLPGIVASYNRVIRGVPHCFPVCEAEFEAALTGPAGGRPSHDWLHSETAFVAREGTSVLGFAHVGLGHEDRDGAENDRGSDRGIIRFLWYERGQRAAGQALLDAASGYVRERGMKRVEACSDFFRYPFHCFPAVSLSDRLDHVRALLQFNGYEPFKGEVFFDWPDYPPIVPEDRGTPVEISLDWPDNGGLRPSLVARALRDGKVIGECVCLSGGEFSRQEAAQDWFFVKWLGINDEYQGRGLGRHLLQRALAEMRAVGYRHAAISTDWKNHRAFVFYSNHGFRIVDWTYAWARDLPAS